VAIALSGRLGPQGYVVDFGIVKRVARGLCDALDERVLVPERSDCLVVEERDGVVSLRYGQDEFRFPRGDVALLPIAHTSVEELAEYLGGALRAALAAEGVTGLATVEVGVEETPGQQAIHRHEA
jgi:6-pyruvoyltetrahydropterin/6-carboxytetrahydropterin synthase